jgi:hypothetical protein
MAYTMAFPMRSITFIGFLSREYSAAELSSPLFQHEHLTSGDEDEEGLFWLTKCKSGQGTSERGGRKGACFFLYLFFER